MSNTVDRAFITQFRDNVIHLAQQEGARLGGAVSRMDVVGKSANVERLGTLDMSERVSRHQDVTYDDIEHSRRRLIIKDYEKALLLDKQDEMKMLLDLRSPYAVALARSAARNIDDVIIAAATADAITVDSDDSTSTASITHTIDEDFSSANTDITLAKVIEAARILNANEEDDSNRHFVLDATAVSTLLQESDVKSIDTNSLKPLVGGRIGSFMGFTFHRSERLDDSSEGFKKCLAFTGDSIMLGTQGNMGIAFDRIPTKGNALQSLMTQSMGAVRVKESGVIVVEAYRA